MIYRVSNLPAPNCADRLWRAAIVAVATLILCSCRSLSRPSKPSADSPPGYAATASSDARYLPEMPWLASQGLPLPYHVGGPWAPDGLKRPWPPEEYLCDGGDQGAGVDVSPDWQLHGLDSEDTVAHYDALDGRTLVEASNKVCIYAPRFGAVRTVTRIAASEQIHQPIGVALPERLARHDEVDVATTTLQRYQARGDVAALLPGGYHSRQGDGALSSTLFPHGFQDAFLPFEDLSVIRNGAYQQADKARLAESTQAAVTWSQTEQVQVMFDHKAAVAVVDAKRAEVFYTVEDLRRHPKLRLIKVASTQTARPGETVDFTLRFDNVGDQPLGNIVLVDNLTTRLEYVPDSAQSSVKAEFSTQENLGESLVLRWEITDPLQPGEGGIVRFRCRVR